MKQTPIGSLAYKAARERLVTVVLASLLTAVLVSFLVPWTAGNSAVVKGVTDRVELTIRDLSMVIRHARKNDSKSSDTPISYGLIEYTENARTAGATNGNLPLGIEPGKLGLVLKSTRSSGVPVSVIDLYLDKKNIEEIVSATKADAASYYKNHSIVVPLRQSTINDSEQDTLVTVGVRADKSTPCLNDPLHPYIDLPEQGKIPQDVNLYLGHAELRYLGSDSVVRGVCLFRSFYVNATPINVKLILPSISLLANALLPQTKTVEAKKQGEAPLTTGIFCLAKNLASPKGILSQVTGGADETFNKLVKECLPSSENTIVRKMVETPIWLDFRRSVCGPDCTFAFNDLAVAEKALIKIPETKALPVGGVVFIGRKDLFANDRVYTNFGSLSHGVDVQVESYVTINNMLGMENFLSTNASETKSQKQHHKWFWALIWALLIGFAWASKEGMATGFSEWLDRRYSETQESPAYFKFVKWLVNTIMSMLFVAFGAACASALALGAVFFETYRIISANESASFQFVAILLISFIIEAVLLLSSIAESTSHAFVHLLSTPYRLMLIVFNSLWSRFRAVYP
jgi:hypothetical protein